MVNKALYYQSVDAPTEEEHTQKHNSLFVSVVFYKFSVLALKDKYLRATNDKSLWRERYNYLKTM